MLLSYKKYQTPINNDICVVMCFFNPVGYKRTVENLLTVIKEFKEYNIPFYIIELLYPHQKPLLQNSIVVKSQSVIFSKENLWNIAESRIPDKYSKIIFLDSDILFSREDWLDRSSELLEHNDVIQSMEWAHKDILYPNDEVFLNPIVHKYSYAKAIKDQVLPSSQKYHPGFCVGIRRDFFHKIGGFFEHGLVGGGDVLFWFCLTEEKFRSHHYKEHLFGVQLPSNAKQLYIDYQKNLDRYYNSSNRVSYVEDCIALHLYHGSTPNRFYSTRDKYYLSDCEYFYNEDGVLEIKSNISKNGLIQYWIDRKEDD
jgi:hypothetical protein